MFAEKQRPLIEALNRVGLRMAEAMRAVAPTVARLNLALSKEETE